MLEFLVLKIVDVIYLNHLAIPFNVSEFQTSPNYFCMSVNGS